MDKGKAEIDPEIQISFFFPFFSLIIGSRALLPYTRPRAQTREASMVFNTKLTKRFKLETSKLIWLRNPKPLPTGLLLRGKMQISIERFT